MNKINIKLILAGLIMVLALPLISAEKMPFFQCIKVLNSDSSVNTSLTCYFSSSVESNQVMTSALGYYCYLINSSSYQYDSDYSYSVRCTDNIINQSITSSFYINKQGVEGHPIPENQTTEEEYKILGILDISFFKKNIIADIIIFVSLAILSNLLYHAWRRKK